VNYQQNAKYVKYHHFEEEEDWQNILESPAGNRGRRLSHASELDNVGNSSELVSLVIPCPHRNKPTCRG
jgi:hypothetical protein